MNQDNGGVIGKINTPTTSLASGVWSLDSQFDSQSSSIWPLAFPQTTIANACRFNSGSSDNLSRTPSGAGNRKTWTWSGWVKRSALSGETYFFSAGDSNPFGIIGYSDEILFFSDVAGVTSAPIKATPAYRDSSAWYHVVYALDTTQATDSNRFKLYVNGEQVTNFSSITYPTLNEEFQFNTTNTHTIGCATGGSSSFASFFDGYMAEVVFVDGQQLLPTSFGAFNPVTNIWEPIAYAGTYGTNGFRLDFADSSALGNDVSGNNNDFTVNNLTSVDQSTDTCSNNFATWNPLDNYYGEGTTSEGNIRYTTGSTNQAPIPATIGVSNGKWYWEVKFVSDTGGYAMIGIASSQTTANNELGHNSTDYAYVSGTGQYRNNDGYTSYGNTYTTGDIIGVALDLENNKLYFSKNGTFQNSGDPTSGSTGTGAISITAPTSTPYGNYFPALSDFGSNTVVFDGNFGSPSFSISSGNADANGHGNFEYAPPSGYFALCTKNLAEFGG